jgi:hypothetical protein
MATARGMDPFLKADLPARAPKRHGQSLPRCVSGFPSYDTGPSPTCHAGWPEARRRQTAAQGACNCPAVMRPFIFAAISGQEDEPLHKEHATAPRLCAPSSSPKPAVEKANRHAGSVQPTRDCAPPQLRCDRWSNMGGPGPHVMQPACRTQSAEKLHRRSRQYHVSSGPSRRTEKISFQNQCSDSRHPAHGPIVTLSTKVTGQSTARTGMAVGVTIGEPAVIASTSAQEQQANRQSDSGPTCRLVSSPEAGLGATVGTLNQGYPYYSIKTLYTYGVSWPHGERHPTPPHG